MIKENLIKTFKVNEINNDNEIEFFKQNNWIICKIENKEFQRIENFGKSDEDCINYIIENYFD